FWLKMRAQARGEVFRNGGLRHSLRTPLAPLESRRNVCPWRVAFLLFALSRPRRRLGEQCRAAQRLPAGTAIATIKPAKPSSARKSIELPFVRSCHEGMERPKASLSPGHSLKRDLGEALLASRGFRSNFFTA